MIGEDVDEQMERSKDTVEFVICYTKGYSDYYDLILCGYINIIMYIVA